MLFVDLSNAFDLAIREILFGINNSTLQQATIILIDLGVSPAQAEQLARELLDNPPSLKN